MNRVGVIIGRFQVPQLHDGYIKMAYEVSKQNDVVCFCIGVSELDMHVG